MTKRKLFYIEENEIYIYDFRNSKYSLLRDLYGEEYCERYIPKIKMAPKIQKKLERIFNLYEAAQNYIETKIINLL